jgi:hypothetical protein
MMVLSIIGGWRVVQLPVNYKARPRSGQPGTTESFTGAFAIGLQMIRLVFRYHRHRKELASALRRAAAARDGWSDADEHPGGEPTHMFWRPSWGRRKP